MTHVIGHDHPLSKLSDRQLEILYLVGKDGLSWEDVEQILSISQSTIRIHAKRILKKHNCTRQPREGLTEIYWRYVAPVTDNRDLRD